MRRWMFVGPVLVMGGILLSPPGQAGEKPVLDGAVLVKERCTGCHAAGRVDRAKKNRKGWEESVDRMIALGAELNRAERDALVAYLSGRR